MKYINDKPITQGFQLPALDLYDKKSNPSEHIIVFNSQMTLYGTIDFLICQTFSTMLRGMVWEWFSKLPLEFISSFS